MALGVTFIISSILYFWCEPLSRLFMKAEDFDVIQLAGHLMRFLAPIKFVVDTNQMLTIAGGGHCHGIQMFGKATQEEEINLKFLQVSC